MLHSLPKQMRQQKRIHLFRRHTHNNTNGNHCQKCIRFYFREKVLHFLNGNCTARERNGTGTGNLDDAVFLQEFAERVNLAASAGEFDDDILRSDINDIRAEILTTLMISARVSRVARTLISTSSRLIDSVSVRLTILMTSMSFDN